MIEMENYTSDDVAVNKLIQTIYSSGNFDNHITSLKYNSKAIQNAHHRIIVQLFRALILTSNAENLRILQEMRQDLPEIVLNDVATNRTNDGTFVKAIEKGQPETVKFILEIGFIIKPELFPFLFTMTAKRHDFKMMHFFLNLAKKNNAYIPDFSTTLKQVVLVYIKDITQLTLEMKNRPAPKVIETILFLLQNGASFKDKDFYQKTTYIDINVLFVLAFEVCPAGIIQTPEQFDELRAKFYAFLLTMIFVDPAKEIPIDIFNSSEKVLDYFQLDNVYKQFINGLNQSDWSKVWQDMFRPPQKNDDITEASRPYTIQEIRSLEDMLAWVHNRVIKAGLWYQADKTVTKTPLDVHKIETANKPPLIDIVEKPKRSFSIWHWIGTKIGLAKVEEKEPIENLVPRQLPNHFALEEIRNLLHLTPANTEPKIINNNFQKIKELPLSVLLPLYSNYTFATLLGLSDSWHNRFQNIEGNITEHSISAVNLHWPSPVKKKIYLYKSNEDSPEEESYKIVVLMSSNELTIEGNTQDHCVGGRFQRCVAAEEVIISIRDYSDNILSTTGYYALLSPPKADGEISVIYSLFSSLGYKNTQEKSEVATVRQWFEEQILNNPDQKNPDFITYKKHWHAHNDKNKSLQHVFGYDPCEHVQDAPWPLCEDFYAAMFREEFRPLAKSGRNYRDVFLLPKEYKYHTLQQFLADTGLIGLIDNHNGEFSPELTAKLGRGFAGSQTPDLMLQDQLTRKRRLQALARLKEIERL